ncbi:NUDIX hydrolase [Pelagicoccus sp. SDUM812002]|uniref:NUDIX hydrolase n=1 Tax=Pelagicoccus sp. SDUM812002 TaxID=3041266 RepID=UPI00280CBB70|nr:NUDIX hydrolase [Pelagicoccus sp. SDUM812002]MDQ8184126.1 NUDIX hydrolase [Pelagicoccus sp. SDUM812002]
MKKWIRRGRKTLIDDRWLKFHADTCELPNGQLIEPFYVLEEKEWAHIVAIDDDGRILLTRQYRYPADRFSSEFPCGCVESEETPLQAAKRELQEETGFVAKDWIPIGSMHANPARQTNQMHCFLARNLSQQSAQNLDESEEIEFGFSTREELQAQIKDGYFTQALHIACYYLALSYLEEKPTANPTR